LLDDLVFLVVTQELIIPTLQIKCHKFLWTMVIKHNHSQLYGWEQICIILMSLDVNAWHMLINHPGNYFQAMLKCSIWYPIVLIQLIFHCFYCLPILSGLLTSNQSFCYCFQWWGTQKFWKCLETTNWTIAHCLEQLPSTRKHYCLFPCDIAELGNTSDNAYLIVWELN